MHAIGDRTNGAVLDAFEKALENIDVNGIRPRIEHAQIMKPSDRARLGRLGGEVLYLCSISVSVSEFMFHSDLECATLACVSNVLASGFYPSDLPKNRTSDMWYAEDRLVRA